VPTRRFYTRKHLYLAAAIIMTIAGAYFVGQAWAQSDAHTTQSHAAKRAPKPILRPPGLLEAKRQCSNHTPLVECRAALRRAIAAAQWNRKRALRARSLPQSNLTPLEVGRAISQRNGWAGRQFECLAILWSRESGWVPTKRNYAGSGAYGIPQALPGSKMRSAGADWETNAATQIRWGLAYIKARYGTPCGALAHSDAHGYY
jgi:hypothetical protein